MINLLNNLNLQITVFLQQIGDWAIPIMNFFTFLGKEEFYLLVMPALYWCIDTILGIRVGVMLLFSANVNSYFKWIFHTPRPYWLYPQQIHAYQTETSFGMPSGHAQNAMSLWGLVAKGDNPPWLKWIFYFIILMIGLSRLFLGVHSIYDILIGWLIGFFLLWIFTRYEKKVTDHFQKISTPAQLGTLLIISILFILVGFIITTFSKSFSIPTEWLLNAASQDAHHNTFDPFSLTGIVSNAGVFLGLVGGAILLQKTDKYKPGGKTWQRLIQYILGLFGVIILWAGLRYIFPTGETFISMAFRYLRYLLLGFWISWAAPKLFKKIKLHR